MEETGGKLAGFKGLWSEVEIQLVASYGQCHSGVNEVLCLYEEAGVHVVQGESESAEFKAEDLRGEAEIWMLSILFDGRGERRWNDSPGVAEWKDDERHWSWIVI